VFDGIYVTSDISQEYLAKLESRRNDYAKRKQDFEMHDSGANNESDDDEGQVSLHSNG
jgi:hypothetical protein